MATTKIWDISSGLNRVIDYVENEKKTAESKKQAMKNHAVENNTCQDDTFFYIVGYTSGGAPYGVTWEEMGLEPWQALEEEQ